MIFLLFLNKGLPPPFLAFAQFCRSNALPVPSSFVLHPKTPQMKLESGTEDALYISTPEKKIKFDGILKSFIALLYKVHLCSFQTTAWTLLSRAIKFPSKFFRSTRGWGIMWKLSGQMMGGEASTVPWPLKTILQCPFSLNHLQIIEKSMSTRTNLPLYC